MKWLYFTDVPFNYTKKGARREPDVWIDCDEMMRDSGRSKGMKLMGMKISIVNGFFIQPDEMLYLHFIGQEPADGIRVGWIRDDNKIDQP